MSETLKRFTFYDLYWKLIKNTDDMSAGRIIKRICAYEFRGELAEDFQDEIEAFIWSSIEDVLVRVKALETSGKTPKSYNKKMKHFAFVDSYYKALKLMSDEDGGAYIKALCGYMFENREPKKLKPPVDGYYELAKLKLELSKVRIISGRKGGNAEKVKVTDGEINNSTKSTECGLTFDEFMRMHPEIKNDLYASSRKLLGGVDWGYLDLGLERCEKYKGSTSLYAVLTHYREIISYAP